MKIYLNVKIKNNVGIMGPLKNLQQKLIEINYKLI